MPGRPRAAHNRVVADARSGGAKPAGGPSQVAQIYQIRVRGHLSAVGAAWFDGLSVANDADGEAVLSGPIRDQAALMAVLRRVHDLGLTLLDVHSLRPDPGARTARAKDAPGGGAR
jgi:hypothetical protein